MGNPVRFSPLSSINHSCVTVGRWRVWFRKFKFVCFWRHKSFELNPPCVPMTIPQSFSSSLHFKVSTINSSSRLHWENVCFYILFSLSRAVTLRHNKRFRGRAMSNNLTPPFSPPRRFTSCFLWTQNELMTLRDLNMWDVFFHFLNSAFPRRWRTTSCLCVDINTVLYFLQYLCTVHSSFLLLLLFCNLYVRGHGDCRRQWHHCWSWI